MANRPQTDDLLVIGETAFRGQHRRFGMRQGDRLRHLYVLGKTGSGKSTLLLNLIAQDLVAGRGLALIDPHGDLFDEALLRVPRWRANEVALVVPEELAHPTSFNVFRQVASGQGRVLLASHLVTLLKSQWSEFWGPRLEYLLRNAALAVSEHPQASLLLLHRFASDASARERLVSRVQDPVVRRFWQVEFGAYKGALQEEMLSSVRNKLGAFVSSPFTRGVAESVRSRLNLRDLIEAGGVLLARLPSGQIGQDNARLLGGLLITCTALAAMSRTPGARPFFLYVDEFQNFMSESLPTILSEARKFGLGLVLANQYLDQLTQSLRMGVLGNVGSLIAFRLGSIDARALEGEFAPSFEAEDLAWLPVHEAAVRLLVSGRALTPFSARMLPGTPAPPQAAKTAGRIRAQSRLRFCQHRGEALPA